MTSGVFPFDHLVALATDRQRRIENHRVPGHQAIKEVPRTAIGLRDRAIVAILIYTPARAGAVAKLKCDGFIFRRVRRCTSSKGTPCSGQRKE